MMKRWLLLFVFFARLVVAEDVVQSDLPSADAAFTGMAWSRPYQSQIPQFVKPDVDNIQFETDGLKRFAGETLGPDEVREVVLIRYHIGDDPLVKVLGDGAKDGTFDRVRVVTHLQDALSFNDGGAYPRADFEKATPNGGGVGKSLSDLRAAGYEYNGEKFGIYSAPVMNPKGERIPLNHEKQMYLIVRNKRTGEIRKITSYVGTGNLASHANGAGVIEPSRVNRVFEMTDQQVARYELDHAERMMAAFKAGKPIKEIESKPSQIVKYANGDLMETAYTDGKRNPNDRIAEVFEWAAGIHDVNQKNSVAQTLGLYGADGKPAKKIVIKEVLASQFVGATDKRVKDGLLAAARMPKSDFNSTIIVDGTFIDTYGYGLFASLDGFDVFRPQGKIEFGVGDDLEKRFDVYGYQRGTGEKARSAGGEPNWAHLWHDKTTWIRAEIDGVEKVIIFTGSLNLSNNFHNAERQAMLVVDPKSLMARAVKESVVETIKAEEGKYAFPLAKAELRRAVARLTGHLPLPEELSPELVDRLAKNIRAKQFDALEREALKLLETESGAFQRPAPDKMRDRIGKMKDFMKWHAKNFAWAYGAGKNVPLRKTLDIVEVLTENMDPLEKKLAIRAALLDPTNPDENVRKARVAEVWDVLKIAEPMPPFWPAPNPSEMLGFTGGEVGVKAGAPPPSTTPPGGKCDFNDI